MKKVYKGHNSPFAIRINDYNNSTYSETEMNGITRVYLKYIPSSGASPEYADSDYANHSGVFDWTSLKSEAKIYIDLGLLDFTVGQDKDAELVVYDATYAEGRVVDQIGLEISDEALGSINLVDILFSLNAISETGDRTMTTSDLGKVIRATADANQTFTLPSVDSASDGKRVAFENLATGDLIINTSDSDTIGNESHTTLTGDSQYGVITLEYVHSLTMWLAVSGYGSWSSS